MVLRRSGSVPRLSPLFSGDSAVRVAARLGDTRLGDSFTWLLFCCGDLSVVLFIVELSDGACFDRRLFLAMVFCLFNCSKEL